MRKYTIIGLALAVLSLTACGGSSGVVESTQARHQGRAFERIAATLSAKPGVTRCWTVVSSEGWLNKTITKKIECEGDLVIPVVGEGIQLTE